MLIYTPEDCTDLCAVTDLGLGKAIKDRMRMKFDENFENNIDAWVDGRVTASDRRLLQAKWLDESWVEFFKEGGSNQVTNAFIHCGMLNAVDGSEDKFIKVQGIENYDIGVSSDESDDSSSSSDESEGSSVQIESSSD